MAGILSIIRNSILPEGDDISLNPSQGTRTRTTRNSGSSSTTQWGESNLDFMRPCHRSVPILPKTIPQKEFGDDIFNLRKYISKSVWQHMLLIPAGKLRQDCEFKVSLGFGETMSPPKKKKKKRVPLSPVARSWRAGLLLNSVKHFLLRSWLLRDWSLQVNSVLTLLSLSRTPPA